MLRIGSRRGLSPVPPEPAVARRSGNEEVEMVRSCVSAVEVLSGEVPYLMRSQIAQ